MNPDVYITIATLTVIVFTMVGMSASNKAGKLEGSIIVAIPAISIIIGLVWPFVFVIGVFVGSCYILSYLVKRFL